MWEMKTNTSELVEKLDNLNKGKLTKNGARHTQSMLSVACSLKFNFTVYSSAHKLF